MACFIVGTKSGGKSKNMLIDNQQKRHYTEN